jgi:hypothetical protein
MLRIICLVGILVPAASQTEFAPSVAREAVALGRTRDTALYNAFQAGYFLSPSGDIEFAEIITEFRRAVMLVRKHADFGEYSYNENNLARDLIPYRGTVAFVAQIRMHPLHVYPAPPTYDMYVRTGPTTKPIPLTKLTREPVYPPGTSNEPSRFTSFRLEGSVPRDALAAAQEPALVITNDRGDVIWQARLEVSRFR